MEFKFILTIGFLHSKMGTGQQKVDEDGIEGTR